ncbi:conserved hypothetical protein [Nitrosomonas nitrosa]|uniref:Integrase catalytic domain-containing protein n=1 Tax=Nitrosomonas nitrosa TaxID=52442 RepID=A0A8H8Z194_9PROT|nr:transposase domain-containing protein [Nitrosomonas nitrosa]CAE6503390.1 conserved hypothetical protein [Nitrosomonas nitrosa]
MTEKHRLNITPKLNCAEVAVLVEKAERTIRENCENSRYPGACKDSNGAWRIPLSSLPPLAQARYWAKNLHIAPDGWQEEERRELLEEEAEALWKFFEGASQKLRQKAYKDAEACKAWQIMKARGIHFQKALDEIKHEFGLTKSALYEKIARIKGYDPQHWPALLVGQWKGENARRVLWNEAAWFYFLKDAISPGRKLKTAWDRTKRQAAISGWGNIPSYDTAKADYSKIDHDVLTLLKEGETALKVKSPTVIREYSLPLHHTWSMDGRRMDLTVIDRKGKYGQPNQIFRLWIYAFQEVRSRMILGYALGRALDSDLLRNAFLDAIKTTGLIIPREVQPDNGMEGAAKEITGGTPWRRRGKVKEDEIIGLFPMLGIEVNWTTVAHGQTKPIERNFLTLAQRIETRYEFRGAYCGNSTKARPEEWDPDKAAPVELVEQAIAEEIAAYNQSPHRGNSMESKSPFQVYTEQINQSGYSARRITQPQKRLCTYSAVAITIRRDASFTIFGASYWSEGTAKLVPGKGYYARYNPHDLSDTVYVYRKEKLLCEAIRKELTPFNDKAAGKEIMKKRASYTKAVKQKAKALLDLTGSESREYLNNLTGRILPEMVDTETGEILPASQVLEIVKNTVEILPADRKAEEDLDNEQIRKEAERLKENESAEIVKRFRQRAISGKK